MKDYTRIHALRAGEIIDIDGLKLRMDEGEITPGDLYVVAGETGTHLLTCDWILEKYHCVIPTTNHYPFDIDQCVRVRET